MLFSYGKEGAYFRRVRPNVATIRQRAWNSSTLLGQPITTFLVALADGCRTIRDNPPGQVASHNPAYPLAACNKLQSRPSRNPLQIQDQDQ